MTNERQKMPADIYIRYWQAFENHLKNNGSTLSMTPSTTEEKYGRTFFHIAEGLDIVATITLSKEGEARGCVEVLLEYKGKRTSENMDIDYNKYAFDKLHDEKQVIIDALNLDRDVKFCWWPKGQRPRKNSKMPRARISCFKKFNSNETADWHEHYPWFIETIGKFDNVFAERLKSIEISRQTIVA